MAEMIITVEEGGHVNLEVNGVQGPGCKQLSEGIEKALGTVTSESKKREFHVRTDNRVVNRQ